MDRIETLKKTLQSLKKGGGIHIKKENRGKFTSYCGGKVTSECIARGKNSPNPAIRKRATFAANARKWKHQWGGLINNNLIYQEFIPEESKEEQNTRKQTQQEVDQTRYPVQSVYVYKPIGLEWEPKGPSIEEVTEDIISGISNANNDNLNEINKQLKKEGYKKTQRAAILATMIAESGANPKAIGDSGKARGLFQWNGNRFNAGIDLASQIQLALSELKDFDNKNAWSSSRKYNKRSAFDIFHNTEDLMEAISALTANFIRPANTDKEIQKRYGIAQQLISQMA